jgi:lysophospholipase L1-like esterase
MRRWLLALVALGAADFIGAHVLIRVRPNIDLPFVERQRLARLQQESVERQYRIESAVFDHDLAKQFDGYAWWGPLRYRITTNSLGFKDASRRVVALRTAGRRVLLLGDSFTEGIGLDYGDSYAGRIARRLGREGTEVLNGAVTSYSPAIYYAKTRYLLDTVGLQITDVVVFIDISDAEDEARYYDLHADGRVTRMRDQQAGRGPEFDVADNAGTPVVPPSTLTAGGYAAQAVETRPPQAPRELSASDSRANAVPAFLKHHSVIARAYEHLRESRESANAPSAYPQINPRRGLWTIDERDYNAFGRDGLRLGSRHMDALVALLRRHGIALTIAVYPWPEQLRYDSDGSIQVRYWREWAGRRGVRFVDLFGPFFRNADRASTIRRFYISGDVHFNAEGADFVATEFLAQWNGART